jgi:hypothetical protein
MPQGSSDRDEYNLVTAQVVPSPMYSWAEKLTHNRRPADKQA